ncbi:hypothetical protein [Micromonospora sp. DT63]|uniref:hypothetical protein n=1 Tax=Micromonospora sp. DT63 TaxID=3393441 RepID=UPI003CF3DF7D
MLPVALTCPLWWVARWATRVLTSLAAVATLAVGASPASAAVPPVSAVPPLSAVPEAAVHPASAVGASAAEEFVPAGSFDAQAAPPVDQGTIATGVQPVSAAGSDRLPLVDASRPWAPRGPPRR